MLPCWLLAALPALASLQIALAGPLGSVSNVTATGAALKPAADWERSSCAVGDVVYLVGDEFPGARACERCKCSAQGDVRCARPACQVRAGCRALHRPDECCPVYQCECEHEGRVYANGEKLVDPADPCKVCYCQGGEVVCRRIACFLRADCEPRLVPGRCCPEYDHCPLTGVSVETSSIATVKVEPAPPSQPPRKEITIKEVTPVSEIPAISSGVRIKESSAPSLLELNEYSYDPTSKAPLIPREATDSAVVASSSPDPDKHSSLSNRVTVLTTKSPLQDSAEKGVKIQVSANSAHKNSDVISTESPSDERRKTSGTRAPLEEDDGDDGVDPFFPQLPDDLSVLSNHEEVDLSPDSLPDRTTHADPAMPPASTPLTIKILPDIYELIRNTTPTTSETTALPSDWLKSSVAPEAVAQSKNSSMLNLRSALPVEILTSPSSLPQDITGELDDDVVTATSFSEETNTVTIDPPRRDGGEEVSREQLSASPPASTDTAPPAQEVTLLSTISAKTTATSAAYPGLVATVETRNEDKETKTTFLKEVSQSNWTPMTSIPSLDDGTRSPSSSSQSNKIDNQYGSVFSTSRSEFEPAEATTYEPKLTSEEISESVTDQSATMEVVWRSSERPGVASGALLAPPRNNNVLMDLISLVDDVRSIGNQTQKPTAQPSAIPESEELIPVPTHGKKSTSKKKKVTANSISESSGVNKSGTRPASGHRATELAEELDEGAGTEAPSAGAGEPTTHRALIDRVSESSLTGAGTSHADTELVAPAHSDPRPTRLVAQPAAPAQR